MEEVEKQICMTCKDREECRGAYYANGAAAGKEANTYVMGILTVAFIYVLYELHKHRRRRGHPGVPVIGPLFDSLSVNVYEEVYENEVNSVPTGSDMSGNRKKRKKHKHKHHHHHHHHHHRRSKGKKKSCSKKRGDDEDSSLDEDETQVSERSDSRAKRSRRSMATSPDKMANKDLIPVSRVSQKKSKIQ